MKRCLKFSFYLESVINFNKRHLAHHQPTETRELSEVRKDIQVSPGSSHDFHFHQQFGKSNDLKADTSGLKACFYHFLSVNLGKSFLFREFQVPISKWGQ